AFNPHSAGRCRHEAEPPVHARNSGITLERVTVARLLRPRGNKGELSAVALSDRRERFSSLRSVTVAGRVLEVENAWWHQDRLVLKFRGIDSISDAEPLAGADVEVAPE